MTNWNFKWFDKIYKKRNTFLSTISWLISNRNFLILFFGFWMLIFLIWRQDMYLVFKLATNLFFVFAFIKIIIDDIIKKITYHPRPYLTKTDVLPIGKKEQNSTSPSGHTTAVTAVVCVLIFYSPWFMLLLPFIPLIMWSRVYNGMHWPLDVFFGLIFGLFFANVSFMLTNLIFK